MARRLNPLRRLKDWLWVAIAVVLNIPLPWEGTRLKKKGAPGRTGSPHRHQS